MNKIVSLIKLRELTCRGIKTPTNVNLNLSLLVREIIRGRLRSKDSMSLSSLPTNPLSLGVIDLSFRVC